MPIPLPELDDRPYRELVAEAQALIPTLYPAWTDHNPTDPGMALVELLAWLTEMVLYRVDQVTDANYWTFLRLLNDQKGFESLPKDDLEAAIHQTIRELRTPHRAVTSEDYEVLAREASDEIVRAKCISRRHLGAGTEAGRLADRAGHVSLIIIPDSPAPAPQPSELLCETVRSYLEPRRILTTRHHVVGPVYVPVSAELLIARRADMPEEKLRSCVVESLTAFLQPLPGKNGQQGDCGQLLTHGPDNNGWPFGRDIYVSELYELLTGIPGVDYIADISLSSQCPATATRCVAAQEIRQAEGDLVGLHLESHHLPQSHIDPDRIVISAAFKPVRIEIGATPAEGSEPQDVRRKVKTTVRHRFHPLYGATAWSEAWHVERDDIKQQVRNLPEIDRDKDINVILQGDSSVPKVSFEPRQLATVQVTISLS